MSAPSMEPKSGEGAGGRSLGHDLWQRHTATALTSGARDVPHEGLGASLHARHTRFVEPMLRSASDGAQTGGANRSFVIARRASSDTEAGELPGASEEQAAGLDRGVNKQAFDGAALAAPATGQAGSGSQGARPLARRADPDAPSSAVDAPDSVIEGFSIRPVDGANAEAHVSLPPPQAAAIPDRGETRAVERNVQAGAHGWHSQLQSRSHTDSNATQVARRARDFAPSVMARPVIDHAGLPAPTPIAAGIARAAIAASTGAGPADSPGVFRSPAHAIRARDAGAFGRGIETGVRRADAVVGAPSEDRARRLSGGIDRLAAVDAGRTHPVSAPDAPIPNRRRDRRDSAPDALPHARVHRQADTKPDDVATQAGSAHHAHTPPAQGRSAGHIATPYVFRSHDTSAYAPGEQQASLPSAPLARQSTGLTAGPHVDIPALHRRALTESSAPGVIHRAGVAPPSARRSPAMALYTLDRKPAAGVLENGFAERVSVPYAQHASTIASHPVAGQRHASDPPASGAAASSPSVHYPTVHRRHASDSVASSAAASLPSVPHPMVDRRQASESPTSGAAARLPSVQHPMVHHKQASESPASGSIVRPSAIVPFVQHPLALAMRRAVDAPGPVATLGIGSPGAMAPMRPSSAQASLDIEAPPFTIAAVSKSHAAESREAARAVVSSVDAAALPAKPLRTMPSATPMTGVTHGIDAKRVAQESPTAPASTTARVAKTSLPAVHAAAPGMLPAMAVPALRPTAPSVQALDRAPTDRPYPAAPSFIASPLNAIPPDVPQPAERGVRYAAAPKGPAMSSSSAIARTSIVTAVAAVKAHHAQPAAASLPLRVQREAHHPERAATPWPDRDAAVDSAPLDRLAEQYGVVPVDLQPAQAAPAAAQTRAPVTSPAASHAAASTGPATQAAASPDAGELAEQAWRIIMDKLAIEQERRGYVSWA